MGYKGATDPFRLSPNIALLGLPAFRGLLGAPDKDKGARPCRGDATRLCVVEYAKGALGDASGETAVDAGAEANAEQDAAMEVGIEMEIEVDESREMADGAIELASEHRTMDLHPVRAVGTSVGREAFRA